MPGMGSSRNAASVSVRGSQKLFLIRKIRPVYPRYAGTSAAGTAATLSRPSQRSGRRGPFSCLLQEVLQLPNLSVL